VFSVVLGQGGTNRFRSWLDQLTMNEIIPVPFVLNRSKDMAQHLDTNGWPSAAFFLDDLTEPPG